MGRRKTRKPNLGGSAKGEKSSLSSPLSLGECQKQGQAQAQAEAQVGVETEIETETCQSQSQGQAETEAESGQSQGSNAEEFPVDDLPPEMWTKILKFVDTHSLLHCRLVNCQWSSMSSGILRQRRDAKTTFMFDNNLFVQKRANLENQYPRVCWAEAKTTLKDFLLCMKESKNCPVACFSFSCQEEDFHSGCLNFFNHEDFKAFLSAADESQEKKNQNQKIKIKFLELKVEELFSQLTETPLELLMEHLRDLLLNKIPNLEELGLDFMSMDEEEDSGMRLFPKTTLQTPSPRQLAHLKVIRFNNSMVSECPGVLKDLLSAAINLKKIYLYKSFPNFSPEPYDFLQRLGKFHLLKGFEIDVHDEFLSQIKERPDFTRDLLKLELEELTVDVDFGSMYGEDNVDATNFMSSLFESSKNSLKKLTMRALSDLHHLHFPRFKNLLELTLEDPHYSGDLFFPRGVRSLDIFPTVSKLYMPEWDWCRTFPPLDSLPVFPRVQNLSVYDIKLTADCIRVVALLCPNLKQLQLHRHPSPSFNMAVQMSFLPVGRQIWTEMKQLESLEIVIHVDVDSRENTSLALDSCFTGISEGNCQRLVEMMEAKKTLEKWGSQCKIPESAFTAEREHPSILDLKHLKRLKINPYGRLKLLDSQVFFTEKLSWISEEFAFKFLPHLKPKPKPETNFNDDEKKEDEKLSLWSLRPNFMRTSAKELILICSNPKRLKIQRDTDTDSSFNSRRQIKTKLLDVAGRQIWNQLKTLESLEIDIDLGNDPLEYYSSALDSFLTGISLESCQRLAEIMRVKKTLEKYGVPANIPQSELELTAEREHPSILDLTTLKTLKINPYAWRTFPDRKVLFEQHLTWVSQEYAFKLMPHLQFNGRKCSED